MATSNSNPSNAPGAGIKPGSLCLIRGLSPEMELLGPANNGDIVTAICFLGDKRAYGGVMYYNVWEITNQKLEAYVRNHWNAGDYIGISAKYLVPINDPDQKMVLTMESLDDLVGEITSVASRVIAVRVFRKLNPI